MNKEILTMIKAIALFLLTVSLLSLLGTTIEIFKDAPGNTENILKIIASLLNIVATSILIKTQKWSYKFSKILLIVSVVIYIALLFIQNSTTNFYEQVLSIALLVALITNKKAFLTF